MYNINPSAVFQRDVLAFELGYREKNDDESTYLSGIRQIERVQHVQQSDVRRLTYELTILVTRERRVIAECRYPSIVFVMASEMGLSIVVVSDGSMCTVSSTAYASTTVCSFFVKVPIRHSIRSIISYPKRLTRACFIGTNDGNRSQRLYRM